MSAPNSSVSTARSTGGSRVAIDATTPSAVAPTQLGPLRVEVGAEVVLARERGAELVEVVLPHPREEVEVARARRERRRR